MTERLANEAQSTLTAGIDDNDLTLTVAAASAFPNAGNFRLRVEDADDDGNPTGENVELMLATAVASSTFTVTRGIESTTAVAHAAGSVATHVLTAGGITQYVTENAATAQTLTFSGNNLTFDVADGALVLADATPAAAPHINAPLNPVEGQRLILALYSDALQTVTLDATFFDESYGGGGPLTTRPGGYVTAEFVYATFIGGWLRTKPDRLRYIVSPAATIAAGEEAEPDPHYSFYTGIADTIYAESDNPRTWGVGIFSFYEGQRAALVINNTSGGPWTGFHIADGGGATSIEDMTIPSGVTVVDIVRANGALHLAGQST